jgi:Rad52/22 family double-strand break repair protein
VLENVELQRSELSKPVDECFVHRNAGAKGAYTTGDYVRLMLNQIFGPDNWSHTVLSGPELVRLNAGGAYVKTLVRLTVRFANGQQVVHEDVGITVLNPGRSLALDEVAPERFETALKAAVTDGLKACAEHLGACFRPLSDADPALRATRSDSSTAHCLPPLEVVGIALEERQLHPVSVAKEP